jgi:hypothetical protein
VDKNGVIDFNEFKVLVKETMIKIINNMPDNLDDN